MECERCGVPWPDPQEESRKLMKRLMDGDTLSTEELMKLQHYDDEKYDEKYNNRFKKYCFLCKHLFQITLNWRRFPHEVL